jgi:hypothetical protein
MLIYPCGSPESFLSYRVKILTESAERLYMGGSLAVQRQQRQQCRIKPACSTWTSREDMREGLIFQLYGALFCSLSPSLSFV